MSTSYKNALSWEELTALAPQEPNRVNGATNSHSLLRLFGNSEDRVRVTLYRDNHAWCPYCQKIWLWLEWKEIPYRIKKVTMRCYGNKENWYLEKVASGMLPALEIDDQLITESDQILLELEKNFGPLGSYIESERSKLLRNLERQLFRAWCIWLCTPSLIRSQENKKRNQFQSSAHQMEQYINLSEHVWLDPVRKNKNDFLPGSLDVIFIPYLERMNASLAYYKGFLLREEHPAINAWFEKLESNSVYTGTQGDIHTHAHDLPPQMGGCYFDKNPDQIKFSNAIDRGKGLGEYERSISPLQKESNQDDIELTALSRVLKHHKKLLELNPLGKDLFDQPLRAALTHLITKKICQPNKGSASGLRYLRDRISVPRDMPLLSARSLRKSLELAASLDSSLEGPSLNTKNRFDQDPTPFIYT